jgi:hypothetical protein
MKKLFTLAFFLTVLVSVSQNKDIRNKENKTTYYFPVEKVSSLEQLDEMKSELSALYGVTSIKNEFKAEKNIGQLIIVVIEKPITSEGDKKRFSPVDVKKIIIRHNLFPAGFQYEQEN